ncbi:nitroreductase family protein [Nesterenkonia ebinurensis]|uniref:nitroreductase family protein n=1 Tax=Nesterenkonia ebinurensis TaxID=2608252 RepID=UPI00123DF110|nr:nitroreductase family protein [Nesterenkonia ebinurensis]
MTENHRASAADPFPVERPTSCDRPSPDDLLRARWGREPEFTPETWNPVLDTILSHRSVRLWQEKEVSEAAIRTVAAAAQSGSTSSHKQMTSVVAVRNQQTKAELAEVGGPKQARHIASAPVVLVWLIDTSRIRASAQRHGTEYAARNYLNEAMIAASDVGIAAQTAALAAESMGLGVVFLGSLRNDAERVAQLLQLPDHVIPFLGMELGHPDPAEPAGVKPRLPQSSFLHWETYDEKEAVAPIEEYDEAISRYFARYGKDRRWSAQMSQRVSETAFAHDKRREIRRVFEKAGFRLS